MVDSSRRALDLVAPHCDIVERLELVPSTARLRGMLFNSIEPQVEERGRAAEYRAYFPGDNHSSVPFYPLRDYLLRLAVAASTPTGPWRRLPSGRTWAPAASSSTCSLRATRDGFAPAAAWSCTVRAQASRGRPRCEMERPRPVPAPTGLVVGTGGNRRRGRARDQQPPRRRSSGHGRSPADHEAALRSLGGVARPGCGRPRSHVQTIADIVRDLRIYARSDEGEAPQLVHLPDLGSGPEAHGGFLARVTNRIVAKPATGVQLLHALAETLREI